MTTMRQIHSKDGITRLADRHIHRHISLGTGMGLNIDVFGTEQFFRPVDGQLLGDINHLATAVITLTRIPFSIFIGQYRALCFQHSLADKIFRGNKFEAVFLTLGFFAQNFGNFRIKISKP